MPSFFVSLRFILLLAKPPLQFLPRYRGNHVFAGQLARLSSQDQSLMSQDGLMLGSP